MTHPIHEAADLRGIARSEILEALKRFNAAVEKIGGKPTIASFAEAYNTGKVKVTPAVREVFPTMHHSSLRRWLRLDDLQPKYRGPDSIIDRNPELGALVAAIQTAHPDLKAPEFREKLIEAGADPVPSLRTLQRHLKRP